MKFKAVSKQTIKPPLQFLINYLRAVARVEDLVMCCCNESFIFEFNYISLVPTFSVFDSPGIDP